MKTLAAIATLGLVLLAWMLLRDARPAAELAGPPGAVVAVPSESEQPDLSLVMPNSAEGEEALRAVALDQDAALQDAALQGEHNAAAKQEALFGRVREDAAPNSPIQGALVRVFLHPPSEIQPVQLSETRSDAEGRYRFDLESLSFTLSGELNDHSVSLWAWAEGHVPTIRSISLEELASGDQPIDLLLRVGASISGRVLDPFLQPLARAKVTLQHVQDNRSSGTTITFSDADGRFVLEDRLADAKLISAHKEGYVRAEMSLNGLDPAALADIGDLVLGLGGRISGRVVCGDGVPLDELEVRALSMPTQDQEREVGLASNLTSTLTDAAGYFELTGLPGEQILIEMEDQSFGPFPVGSDIGDLIYPGRRFTLVVRSEESQLPERTMIEISSGKLVDGKVESNRVTGRSLNQSEGSLVVNVGRSDTVVLRVHCPAGNLLERQVTPPPGVCQWEEILVVPAQPQMGSVELAIDYPRESKAKRFNLRLESRSIGMFGRNFGGLGVHAIAAGNYRATVRYGKASTSYFVPLVIDSLEVVEGRTTRISQGLIVGGRLSLELLSMGVEQEPEAFAAVYWQTENGPSRVHFFEEGTSGTELRPRFGRAYVSRTIFPPGIVGLEIQSSGHETTAASITIIPEQVVEHRVSLLPERE